VPRPHVSRRRPKKVPPRSQIDIRPCSWVMGPQLSLTHPVRVYWQLPSALHSLNLYAANGVMCWPPPADFGPSKLRFEPPTSTLSQSDQHLAYITRLIKLSAVGPAPSTTSSSLLHCGATSFHTSIPVRAELYQWGSHAVQLQPRAAAASRDVCIFEARSCNYY
jgi:hypothetical protein